MDQMSKDALSRAAAIGAVLALGAAPAALAARPDNPGSQGQGHGGSHGKSGTKTVSYVFKGTYAGVGSVDVDHGNTHVRKADLLDTSVSFDLSTARIVVATASEVSGCRGEAALGRGGGVPLSRLPAAPRARSASRG